MREIQPAAAGFLMPPAFPRHYNRGERQRRRAHRVVDAGAVAGFGRGPALACTHAPGRLDDGEDGP